MILVARSPDLRRQPLMNGGLRCVWAARPTGTAYDPIPVRQAATPLHASFRRRVATAALALRVSFTSIKLEQGLPPCTIEHAWHTKNKPGVSAGLVCGVELVF